MSAVGDIVKGVWKGISSSKAPNEISRGTDFFESVHRRYQAAATNVKNTLNERAKKQYSAVELKNLKEAQAAGKDYDMKIWHGTGALTNKDRLKAAFRNNDGSFNKTTAAAAGLAGYAGISSVGRIASGGGLYRDSDGNFDIMGIPIV